MMTVRYELAIERIKQIAVERNVESRFDEYFCVCAQYICMVDDVRRLIADGDWDKLNTDKKREWNRRLYANMQDEAYDNGYLNPAFATDKLGEYGQALSAIYAELQSLPAYAFDGDLWMSLIRYELFLEVYGLFEASYVDGESTPEAHSVVHSYAAFAFDYLEQNMDRIVCGHFTYSDNLCGRIVREADLTDTDYLYDYGEYISDTELRLARYMNSLSQEEIDSIARTFTEGYRIGFITTGKDLSIKDTVDVRFFIGFERVVRAAIGMFEELGLKSIIYRAEPSFVMGRRLEKIGCYSTVANKQFESDHAYDKVLYFNKGYVERRLEAYHKALEHYKSETGVFGGPAVIEGFGEEPFAPTEKAAVIKPDKVFSKLFTDLSGRMGAMLNEYVHGDERSFTIISFPTPAIGDRFERIFDETITINTLDYMQYRDMQQVLIDALDQAEVVRVQGTNGNETDITIALWQLENPDKETIFENCVADVNIPVGEVFTSPRLEGTYGLLHTRHVYLEGLLYEDLRLQFEEGKIVSYSCANYSDENKNKEYIKEHLLFQHETLPIGEFAIGTNTVAYKVTKDYDLWRIMPILIAEKTGPHFAVGDTCYSHEEDVMTYNPDGKAIVARQNSISATRDEDPVGAYFNCHTDITIPYDELGRLFCICADGREIDIIRDGRFVLKGLEPLNEPLD